MKSITHYALGALVTGAVVPPLSRAVGLDLTPAELGVGIAIGTLAGVLPDIDTPRSVVTHGLLPLRGRGASVAVLLGELLSIPPRAVGVLARSVFEHRGATHSLAFAAIWALLAAPLYAALGCALIVGSGYLVDLIARLVAGADPVRVDPIVVVLWILTRASEAMPLVILCVLCGYLSHLLADAITIAPIRLWWPSRRRVWMLPRPLRIKTGGSFERHLVQPLAVIGAVVVIVVQVGIPLCNAIAAHLGAAALASGGVVVVTQNQVNADGAVRGRRYAQPWVALEGAARRRVRCFGGLSGSADVGERSRVDRRQGHGGAASHACSCSRRWGSSNAYVDSRDRRWRRSLHDPDHQRDLARTPTSEPELRR